MKQVIDSTDNKSVRELQALKNALTSFNLTGYEVLQTPLNKRHTYILRDDKGTSLTGYWTYDQLNHFILGYGKALKALPTNKNTAPLPLGLTIK